MNLSKSKKKSRSISKWLTISLITSVFLVSVIVIFINYYILSTKYKKNLNIKADEYISILSSSLTIPLWNCSEEEITSIAKSMFSNEIIALLKIIDIDGGVYYFDEKKKYENSPLIFRIKKLKFDEKEIGIILLAISSIQIVEINNKLLQSSLITLFVILITIIFVTGFLLRIFLKKPLETMSDIIKDYKSGKKEITAKGIPYIEFINFINVLTDMCNTINQQISEIKQAEDKYRSIFENAVEGIFQTTVSGRFISANPSMANILGYDSPQDLLNSVKDISKEIYYDPLDRNKILKMLLNDGSIFDFEVKFVKKSTQIIWCSISARSVKDEYGYLLYIEGTLVDISERKNIEKKIKQLNIELEQKVKQRTSELNNTIDALKESEEKYKGLYDSSKDGIFFINEYLQFQNANNALLKLSGYSLTEILTMNICETSLKTFVKIEREMLFDMLEKDYSKEYEKDLLKKDGSIVPVEIRLWPLKDNNNKIIGIWGFVKDITELKKNQQLQNDVERMVKHDIKNPLSYILNFSNNLTERPEISNKDKQILKKINSSGLEILTMLDNSLDLFKMEDTTYKLKPKNFDLISILKMIIESFNNLIDHKKIIIQIFLNLKLVDETDVYIICGEKFLLKNLFSNLIKNAIEASKKNEDIKIFIKNNEKKEKHEIIVHNQGVIPKEIRKNFFDKYVTFGKTKGTGFGTYSAFLIAKTHKGQISFNTSTKNGTDLLVEIPYLDEDQTDEEIITINKKPISDVSILIADDNANNRLILQSFLENEPFKLHWAVDGLELFNKFKQNIFDLLLIDIQMPVMSGTEAITKIRNYEKQNLNSRVPIIAITADSSEEMKKSCKDIDCNSFVGKPFNQKKILSEIYNLL